MDLNQTILKHALGLSNQPGARELKLPRGSLPLAVRWQGMTPYLWTIGPDRPNGVHEMREVVSFFSGQSIPDKYGDSLVFIGTLQTDEIPDPHGMGRSDGQNCVTHWFWVSRLSDSLSLAGRIAQ